MPLREYKKKVVLILSYFARKEKGKLLLLVLSNLIMALLDLLGVAILGILTAFAVQGAQSLQPGNKVSAIIKLLGFENSSFHMIISLFSISALIIFIVKTILSSYITKRTLFFLGYRSAALSSDLMRKLLEDRIEFVQSKSVQELAYAVNAGASYSVLGVIGSLTKFGSDLILLVVLALGLIIVDWKTAFAIFFIFGLTGKILSTFLHKQATELGVEYSQKFIEGNQITITSIESLKEISVRGTSDFFGDLVSSQRFSIAKVESQSAFLGMISKYVFEIIVIFSAFTVAAIQLSINTPSRGAAIITVFLASISRAAPAALRAQQTVTQLQNYFAKIKPTLELMERFKLQRIHVMHSPKSLDYPEFEAEICLRNVNFKYNSESDFNLRNINLEIAEGDFVAILGPSGAGKSTLIDLILGVYEPSSGEITISGMAPSVAIKKFPGVVGFMPQDTVILSNTIKHNIDLGFTLEEINESHYYSALKFAELEEVIQSMPNGLMQIIGENGIGLSGGQKQRLGIARAIFTNPRILILDEATNALDSETEFALTNSINNLAKDRTVLAIAHNLSTIRNANRFVFIENGILTEGNSIEDLKSKIPRFEKIANLQGL